MIGFILFERQRVPHHRLTQAPQFPGQNLKVDVGEMLLLNLIEDDMRCVSSGGGSNEARVALITTYTSRARISDEEVSKRKRCSGISLNRPA